MAGSAGQGDWDPKLPPRTPNGMRIYAVGDIHGRADLLDMLLDRIEEDLAERPVDRAATVYVGDYVDRGPDSRGVVELLLQRRPDKAQAVHLKGNHEDLLMRFLADPAGQAALWLSNGGMATLRSYGVSLPWPNAEEADLRAAAAELAAAMGEAHRGFFANLKPMFECGDYLFVHAGMRPGVSICEQSLDDLLWIRGEFLLHRQAFAKYVVHGHTPRDGPELLWNRANIDTGAFVSGRLTCLVLEGDDRRILTAEGEALGC